MTEAESQGGRADDSARPEPDRGAVFLPSSAPASAAPGEPGVVRHAAVSHPVSAGPRALDADERWLLVGVVAWVITSGGFAVGAMLAAMSWMGGEPEAESPLLALGFGVLIAVLFPPSLAVLGAIAAGAYLGGRSVLRSHPLDSLNGWSDLSRGVPSVLVRGAGVGAAVSAFAVVGMLMAYSLAGASTDEFVLGAFVIAVTSGVIATALVVRSPRTAAVIGSSVGATAAAVVVLAIALPPT